MTKAELEAELKKSNALVEELTKALQHLLRDSYLDPRLLCVMHANRVLEKVV